MKLSLSWLKAYVDVDLPARELGHRMTLAGVELDSVEAIGGTWEGVVVGRVTEVAPHPNADRLRLATVDTGSDTMTVVCGAPNVAAGQKIAFARAGAKLLDGHSGQPAVLKPAKIRGVESHGMVCSERELGLSTQHEGILVLPEDAPVGTPLADYMGDAVLDFAVTANRPDCLSVLGIAREAAAITGKPLREPSLVYAEAGNPIAGLASVEIADAELCPRYIATVVTGVKIAPSPKWMQDRLAAAGVRAINNVVDITNYVMLEYGQPLHAFDYDKLAGHKIVVRRAAAGEKMTTIDGVERTLAPHMLVIADAGRPVAIAGVMGGSESEVSEATVSVLLESACFNNISVRRTGREVGMRSEASLRFEKGLPEELPHYAARRATQLLVEIAGGVAAQGMLDVFPGKKPQAVIRLTEQRARQLLGVAVPAAAMAETLRRLGFVPVNAGADALDVAAPYWRTDIAIEDDLIEEVVRVRGYEWIPSSTAVGRLPAYEPAPMIALKDGVRDCLAASGMNEAVTYSLTSAQGQVDGITPLRVQHPMSAELEELRTGLRRGLLRTLASNQRQQEDGVRIFECGRVYLPRPEDLPLEREMLAGVLSGPRAEADWHGAQGEMGFYDGKGMVEGLLVALGVGANFASVSDPLLHPGRTASVTVAGVRIGVIGEVHPREARVYDLLPRPVAYFELNLDALLPLLPSRGRAYAQIPRYPGVVRDIALVVDRAMPAQRATEIIAATPLVHEVTLFDVYTGEHIAADKKSLAYRIVYLSPSRTLSGDQADKTQARLLERLAKEAGATLRE